MLKYSNELLFQTHSIFSSLLIRGQRFTQQFALYALFWVASVYFIVSKEFKGIWIPKEVLEIQDIGTTEKMVLSTILALSKNGGCKANNRYFSDLFGISKTRVSIIINNLYNKSYIGYVTKVKGGIKENEKRVLNFTYTGYVTKVIPYNIKNNNTNKKDDRVTHPLQLFIFNNFPLVGQIKTQLSFKDCEYLEEKFPMGLISEKLEAMENTNGIEKTKTSVNITLHKWCNQDLEAFRKKHPIYIK